MKYTCWIALLILPLQSGCYLGNSSPHESFKEHGQWYVGKTIQFFRSGAGIPESIKKLSNGNMEEEHVLRKGKCRVFYEYNSETGIIVNWRFEGGEKECIQNPYT